LSLEIDVYPVSPDGSEGAVKFAILAVFNAKSITRARSPLKGRHQTHAKLKSILTFAFFAPLW
jgi:hypothetical protein